ncbi:S8 family serine peptidase [Candidatus Fermentibacteria bacterium]|nr:S8 family serine peptidase [Candidatus Fermentibacteria bacterium]
MIRCLGFLVVLPLMIAQARVAEPIEDMIILQRYAIDPRTGGPVVPPELSSRLEAGVVTYGIVKFDGPTTETALEGLRQGGVEPVRYLPYHAWIVRGDGAAILSWRGDGGVTWVGPYHPAFKIASTVGNQTFMHPARAEDPLLWLKVRLFPTERGSVLADEVEAMGGEVREIITKPLGDLLVVHAPPELVHPLARMNGVEWIEEIPECFLLNNRTKWVLQSNQTDGTPAWDRGLHGEGQIIGIMDSGLDYNSCFFRDPEGDSFGANHRKVQAYRLTGGAAYDGCADGHGTHVTGTVLGEDIFGTNSAYNGLAYKARLTFQDVGQDDSWACSTGSVNIPSDLEPSYLNSLNDGAYLHTNSWGSSSNTYDSMAQDVDNFMWNHKNFLIFFAMGNAGPNSGTIGSPATAKNCVSVGATQQAPSQHLMASYSSRGPAYDTRRKPTIVAPGGETGNYINSANNTTGNPPSQTCNVQGNPFRGTSMATPASAAAGLLVRQYFTEGYYPTGVPVPANAFLPSAALIKATLVNSGTTIGGTFPDNNQGWGRILLDDALYFPADPRQLSVVDESVGITTGQTRTYAYTAGTSQPLEIVLVWTDYPAAQGTGVALVNDLDLEVTAPTGFYLGNVYSGGQSCTGGSADRRNVVECAQFNTPAAGSYSITVRGHNIPYGPQPFAVVVTGDLGGGTPDTESPGCIGDLMAGPGPVNGIRLTWSNPGDNVGVTRYDIYRAGMGHYVPALGGELHTLLGNPPPCTWIDPAAGAAPGEQYFYRIIAADAAGNRSAPSNTAGDIVWELTVGSP